jgi:hypothetical protein
MATCKDCIHEKVCGYYVEFEDEADDCPHFKNKADFVEVVRCEKCIHSREINRNVSPEKYFNSDCIMCECEDVVGDEPMVYLKTHFCSCGTPRDGGAE